jgi:predicted amidohydrolase YtcJ
MNTILCAKRIITLDSAQPSVEAVLCRDGRVVATGSVRDLQALEPRATIQDHGRRVLTPGLTDAHLHPVSYGFSLQWIKLEGATSLADALELVRQRALQTPAGEWVIGFGFDRAAWGLLEYPQAAWLDDIAPHHPVLLRSRDGHAIWLNSAALERAGITDDTPDPDGGRIERNERGRATGTLLELAGHLALKAVPEPSFAVTLEAARAAIAHLSQLGFTALHSMAAEPPAYLRALLELEHRGELPMRISACLPHAQLEAIEALGLRGGLGDRVRLDAIKFFNDGALGSRTAWMHEPYLGFGDSGLPVDAPETIFERGSRAIELGFGVTVHAIGDRANSEVIAVFQRLQPLAAAHGVRLRLEHAQHLRMDDIAPMARAGIIASTQPIHLPLDAATIERTLGPTRAANSFAFRSMIDAGVIMALGSDAPVATPDSTLGFAAAVDRLDANHQPWHPEQRLTRLETLLGYTANAAFAANWQDWYGRIRPGYAADFTAWDGDPTLEAARPRQAIGV